MEHALEFGKRFGAVIGAVVVFGLLGATALIVGNKQGYSSALANITDALVDSDVEVVD